MFWLKLSQTEPNGMILLIYKKKRNFASHVPDCSEVCGTVQRVVNKCLSDYILKINNQNECIDAKHTEIFNKQTEFWFSWIPLWII